MPVQKSAIDLYVIDKVREMRFKAGYSQLTLALKLNVSAGFISHVESPHRSASYNLRHLNELSAIFNCSAKDFLPDGHV